MDNFISYIVYRTIDLQIISTHTSFGREIAEKIGNGINYINVTHPKAKHKLAQINKANGTCYPSSRDDVSATTAKEMIVDQVTKMNVIVVSHGDNKCTLVCPLCGGTTDDGEDIADITHANHCGYTLAVKLKKK